MKSTTITVIGLLINQILGGPSTADKATELQNTKVHLSSNEVLLLKQPCGTHPTINSNTLITYKLEDNGNMQLFIGKDKSLECNKLDLKDIKGYYIKNNETNEILLMKNW